jgi:hypothetical protein
MGLMRAGFHVTGVDINPQIGYPGDNFIQVDALLFSKKGLRSYDFLWASSPCTGFAKWGMRHFFPNPPYPAEGIELFNRTREMLEASGKPYVMENVRAAQNFVGPSTNHCGPFYFWGNGLPAIMPAEFYKLQKGMTRRAMGQREYKGQPGWNLKNTKGEERGSQSRCAARSAMIPVALSEFIGRQAIQYLRRVA